LAALLRDTISGRRPNFAALNTGRHLYSAGRPSRWALADILIIVKKISQFKTVCKDDSGHITQLKQQKLECGPMPNVMAALPNIGDALCSTPQSLADAHY